MEELLSRCVSTAPTLQDYPAQGHIRKHSKLRIGFLGTNLVFKEIRCCSPIKILILAA